MQQAQAVRPSLDEFRDYFASIPAEADAWMISERVRKRYTPFAPGFEIDQVDQSHFIRLLYRLVLYFGAGRIVQTGTFTGVSAVAMLLAGEDLGRLADLVTIDPEPTDYFCTERPVDLARAVIEANHWVDRVSFLRGFSGSPPKEDPPGALRDARAAPGAKGSLPSGLLASSPDDFDLAVVDGDHSFRCVLEDLTFSAAKLSPAGPRLIAAHDYNGIPEVRGAVDRFRSRLTCAHRSYSTATSCGVALIQLTGNPEEKEQYA